MSAVSERIEKIIGGIGQGSDSMSAVKNGVDATSDPLKAINSGLDMAKTVFGWLELADKACPSCGYGVNIAKLGNAIREVDADIKGGKDIKLGVLIDATTSVTDMIGDTSLTRGAIVPGLTIKAASTILSYVGLVWGDTVVITAPENTTGTGTTGTSPSDGIEVEVIEPFIVNTWTDLTDANGNTVLRFDEKGNFTLYNQDSATGQRKSIDVSFSTSSSGKEASLTINDEVTGTTENTLNCNIDDTGTVYNALSDANENLLYTSTINSNTVTSIEYDTNGNTINKEIGLNNGDSTYNFQLINQSNQDLSNLFDREYEFKQLYELGGLNTSFYNYVTQEISDLIVTAPIIDVPNLYDGFDGLSLNPIGAFYETVTPANDPALSIADKTFVVLDSTNKGITATALSLKDRNHDGKLTGIELSGLNMWRDLNENGVAESGEITTLSPKKITSIRAEDYGMYTQGNAKFASAVITAPTKINTIQNVPASNFRTLRDTDNVYYVGGGRINWAKNQIKINYSNRSYLIGTDGNDSFDSNYYAKYTQYFNSSLLVNFLAGGGNDFMGGSARNDNLWGGTGNDVLFGYAGNDKLYGEEGDDELQGQVGNDYLDGGIGNDRLFGQVGNDVLVGGDGNDLLVGFTATNESKQTLLSGESDNDTLYGGKGLDNLYGGLGNDYLDGGDDNDFVSGDAGDDTLFGGNGDDELSGGAGNDKLLGEAGNDKIFGQVGDDIIWGGEGNDILVGFTASNDTKQTLSAGESDNDTMYGGNGDDLILGGLGNDTLLGEAQNDELHGGAGNDFLYGGDGIDKLFGQVGNDVLYGGEGNDILVGFTASNETKQTLSSGESDNDWLYGGAGNDTLLGGLGNDYLDGGAGADDMQGGAGNDTYIVNSVNDTILEHANEGYDTVISSSNYILNYGIEELRLVEALDIHGTGNSLDNKIVGNSRNNIIDGVTGADTMIGAGGDDTYYVDNAGDRVLELANDGIDTVQTTISYTLGENTENLVLLDFSKAEKGLVDGEAILVYGYPKMNELDYMQGDAIPDYQGTCALTAIANLLTQVDQVTSEAEVVQLAIDNQWAVTDAALPAYTRGGSNYVQQQQILDSYGMRNDLLMGYNENGIANLIKSGRGVILALNAGKLWDDAAYVGSGGVNHVVTITGAAYSESTGALTGFYIADSGRQKVSDMTRYVGIDLFREAANVPNAYAIYTIEPLKMWDEDINATGNALDNTIIGNRGDNTLIGGAGNDSLQGGSGNDTYTFAQGDGADTLREYQGTNVNAGYDVIQFSAGVSAEDIALFQNGSSLLLSYGNNDVINITDQFTTNNAIEKFTLADGNFLTSNDLNVIIQSMNSYATANDIAIETIDSVKANQDLMNIVAGAWHQ